MGHMRALEGIICAVVTPLRDGEVETGNLQRHIKTLATEGCHGVLVMGTTGEGPSLTLEERRVILEAARAVADDLIVMAGTGCASLKDTITATRDAFSIGADAVVVVPPFYFKRVSTAGLTDYYRQIFDEAVPDDGALLAYHIPQVSSVPITFDLLDNLLQIAGPRMTGIKDSSGDRAHGLELCERFPQLRVFSGTERLFMDALNAGAVGCITAGTNILTPLAVEVYERFKQGQDAEEQQALLTQARSILDRFPPYAPTLKKLLAARYGTLGWEVRAPLMPFDPADEQAFRAAFSALDVPEQLAWLKA